MLLRVTESNGLDAHKRPTPAGADVGRLGLGLGWSP